MGIRCRSTRSHKPTPGARTQESGLVPLKLRSLVRNQTYGSLVDLGWADDRQIRSSAHLFSALLRKNGVRTADGHRAYVLALARIRFRGTRDAVHRNRPRGVARVEHLTRLAPP